MRIIISAAVSVDGYIDDATPQRLILSSPEDYEDIHALRKSCDAVLVGAETIRRDNPALTAARLKVTLTRTGNLPPDSRFFHEGRGKKLIYTTRAEEVKKKLKSLCDVAAVKSLPGMLRDLEENHGVETLLVEGGMSILTQFLAGGFADELRLAVAPLFVGDYNAPRFVGPAAFPHNKDRRMKLRDIYKFGDTAVMHYDLVRKA